MQPVVFCNNIIYIKNSFLLKISLLHIYIIYATVIIKVKIGIDTERISNMTDIIFSFDVEDYIHKIGADGILRSIQLLSKHNVRGCFNVVARLAMALEQWERQDIIKALKEHEITSHTLDHSHHPTICEYTDLDDYNAALDIFLKTEGRAINILKAIFDIDEIPSACPPGISTSYVAHYGYAKLGVPVYDGDTIRDDKRGRPINFCNILTTGYNWGLEDHLFTMTKEEIKEAIYKVTQEKDLFVIWHHPQMAYLKNFWDGINYNGVNTHPDNWKESPRHTDEDVERFYENFDYLLGLLKSDPEHFNFTTYSELAKKHYGGVRKITKDVIVELNKQLKEEFFPVTTPDSYCLTDIMYGCRELLQGKNEHICKDVYGFLYTPYTIEKEITLTKDEVIKGSYQITDSFLPEKIVIDDKIIGPADWLRAAMEILCGKKKVTVAPGPWQIDLDQFPWMKTISYKNNWVHSPDFKDEYLSNRFRMQSWTIRFDRETPRKVFD